MRCRMRCPEPSRHHYREEVPEDLDSLHEKPEIIGNNASGFPSAANLVGKVVNVELSELILVG